MAANNVDYRSEEVRLQSFEDWPNENVRPVDLAAAGFYYIKKADRTRCFECLTEICRWEEGEDPMVEHRRWGGRCRFIKKLPCGNIPINAAASTVSGPLSSNHGNRELHNTDYRAGTEVDLPRISKSTDDTCRADKERRKKLCEEKATNDARICKICYDKELGIAFLPCGHIIACIICAFAIPTCAICREPVTTRVRIFLP